MITQIMNYLNIFYLYEWESPHKAWTENLEVSAQSIGWIKILILLMLFWESVIIGALDIIRCIVPTLLFRSQVRCELDVQLFWSQFGPKARPRWTEIHREKRQTRHGSHYVSFRRHAAVWRSRSWRVVVPWRIQCRFRFRIFLNLLIPVVHRCMLKYANLKQMHILCKVSYKIFQE